MMGKAMSGVVPIRPGVAIPSRAVPDHGGAGLPVGKPVRGLHPLRRLAVHGLNELLDRGLVSRGPVQCEAGRVATRIGDRPSMIMWHEIGGGELRLTVWWNFDLARHPQANGPPYARETFSCALPLAGRDQYPDFVGACVSVWVERRTGFWLQGKGSDYLFSKYVRRTTRDALAALPDPIPLGFATSGRFYL